MLKTLRSVAVQNISTKISRNMTQTVKSSVFVLVSVFSFALVAAVLAADALAVRAVLAAQGAGAAPAVAVAADVLAAGAAEDAADVVDAVLIMLNDAIRTFFIRTAQIALHR
jgi:hypothetical protein